MIINIVGVAGAEKKAGSGELSLCHRYRACSAAVWIYTELRIEVKLVTLCT